MDTRRKQHEKNAELGAESVFYKALRKYGVDAFEWRVLMEEDAEFLNESEIACIKLLDTKVPVGYNLTDGGDGTIGLPEEMRHRHSLLMAGRKHSKEHCEAISRALSGKPKTKEHCEAVSRALLGRKLSPDHVVSLKAAERPRPTHESNVKRSITCQKYKCSEETRSKISRAKVGKSSKLKGQTYDDIYGIDADYYRTLRSMKRKSKTLYIEET